jgi:hypothetical protein
MLVVCGALVGIIYSNAQGEIKDIKTILEQKVDKDAFWHQRDEIHSIMNDIASMERRIDEIKENSIETITILNEMRKK